jgi:hypothetical protein
MSRVCLEQKGYKIVAFKTIHNAKRRYTTNSIPSSHPRLDSLLVEGVRDDIADGGGWRKLCSFATRASLSDWVCHEASILDYQIVRYVVFLRRIELVLDPWIRLLRTSKKKRVVVVYRRTTLLSADMLCLCEFLEFSLDVHRSINWQASQLRVICLPRTEKLDWIDSLSTRLLMP